jgi:phosphoglycerate dehydrogenase-like enzyme
MVLVGYGSVGREAARLATAFGMHVIAVKARPDSREDDSFHEPGRGDPTGILPDRIVGLEGLPNAMQHADYLVVTLPLTPSTQGLISRELLECLQPTAWLINVSRGKVIDEDSLIECLRQRRIAGAYLDVFAKEPLPSDSELWALPNVIISPHISGGGADSVGVLTDLCCENLRRYVEGEPLINIVRPEWGY